MSNELKPVFFIWFAVFQAVTNACLHRSAAIHSFIFIFYVWYGLFARSALLVVVIVVGVCVRDFLYTNESSSVFAAVIFCAALIKYHRPKAVNVI